MKNVDSMGGILQILGELWNKFVAVVHGGGGLPASLEDLAATAGGGGNGGAGEKVGNSDVKNLIVCRVVKAVACPTGRKEAFE